MDNQTALAISALFGVGAILVGWLPPPFVANLPQIVRSFIGYVGLIFVIGSILITVFNFVTREGDTGVSFSARIQAIAPLILIVICASGLLVGIVWQLRRNVSARLPDISWLSEDFEHTGHAPLDMHRKADQPFLIDGFSAYGRNNADWSIQKISGYVFSEKQNRRYPIFLVTGNKLVELSAVESIPAHGEFTLAAPFSPGWPNPEGISSDSFISDICPITFVFDFDGKNYSRHFTAKELEEYISNQNRRSGYVPPIPKIKISDNPKEKSKDAAEPTNSSGAITGNQGIITFGQSGGSNTVTYGPPVRRISDAVAGKIIEALKPIPHTFLIVNVGLDPETNQYAARVQEIFIAAGWTPQSTGSPTFFQVLGNASTELCFMFKSSTFPNDVDTVFKAFSENGVKITRTYNVFPGIVSADTIGVVVGKPAIP